MKKKTNNIEKNDGKDNYYVFYKDDGEGSFEMFDNEEQTNRFLARGLTGPEAIEICFVVLGKRLYPKISAVELSAVAPDLPDKRFPVSIRQHTVNGLVKRLDSLKSEEMKVRNELDGRG